MPNRSARQRRACARADRDREGEHASQALRAARPRRSARSRATSTSVSRRAAEEVALAPAAAAQLAEVVDLAVVDDQTWPSSLAIGWRPSALRSMIDSRRIPMPAPPSTNTPPASGPRCTMAETIASISPPRTEEPFHRTIPAIPHTVLARLIARDLRPHRYLSPYALWYRMNVTSVVSYEIIPSARSMNILGINAFHGDASAALVKDGELVAAIEEERLNRRKHCAGFPALAVKAVLEAAGVAPGADRPRRDLARSQGQPAQEDPLRASRSARRSPSWSRIGWPTSPRCAASTSRWPRRWASKRGRCAPSSTPSSTTSRTSRAPSSSRRSRRRPACRSTASATSSRPCAASGATASSRSSTAIEFPHSAGLFYTAVTQFLGFHRYGEEWKMMGLAPYGKPTLRRAAAPGHPSARRRPLRARTSTTSATTARASR